MQSILQEITSIRNGTAPFVDLSNCNRYSVVSLESDGTKISYYFTTPIYNEETRELVNLHFQENNGNYFLIGSNAKVTVANTITITSSAGQCCLKLPCHAQKVSEGKLRYGNSTISPTTNGIAICAAIDGTDQYRFSLELNRPFLAIKANDRYVALMKEAFTPFIIVSVIGVADENGHIIAPAKLEYQRITDRQYAVTITSSIKGGKAILFELNSYENKLLQDTTVESASPTVNNVFGSVGFIGNTSVYGEQWLYSKPDYALLSDMFDKQIENVILHIPQLNDTNTLLNAFTVNSRFCSFGSNWQNKLPVAAHLPKSSVSSGYHHINMTPLFVDNNTHTLQHSHGFILRSTKKDNTFSVLPTADSYYAPQILEIVFK